jgi:hypothetical protein
MNDEAEEWRPVDGWEEYSVSNYGRARGPRSLLSLRARSGYPQIILSRKGRKKIGASVHRLVAAAFIGPIPPGLVVNHINGIRSDNRVSNLEIITQGQNISHAIRTGLKKAPQHYRPIARGEDNPKAILTNEQVRQIKLRLATGRHGIGRTLAREFGVSEHTISKIKHGQNWPTIIPQPPAPEASAPPESQE